jgi:hypothetical protein
LQRGFVSPQVLKRSLSHRDRGLKGAGMASAQIHARPGPYSASHQGSR